ncbi:MAG: T9SS type A sorting domain-containing protein [Paludibacteraceae bacterium]
MELSYYTHRATVFSADKEHVYLIIDRTGTGNFTTEVDEYKVSEIDSIRSKLIFNNVIWDKDGNGKDLFTFGYKQTSPQTVKRQSQDNVEDEPEHSNYAHVYYRDIKDLSHVTVKVYLYEGKPYTVLVTDIAGRIVYKNDYLGSMTEQFTDIKLPHPGFYVVKVMSASYQYSAKVLSDK